MDYRKCPPDGDKGLRVAGAINTLVELMLGASIMIVFAFILFVFVRTNYQLPSLSASAPTALKTHSRHYQMFNAERML